MEDTKAPKKSVRKTFRNIWLFSMLAFLVVLVSFYLVGIIFKISQFSGTPQLVFMILFGLIGLIGGTSFLAWVSILIFSNKPLRIVWILLGIFVSSLYFLTAYSVSYVYIYSRVNQENTLGLLDLIIPLFMSGAVLSIWLKTKPIIIKGVIITLLLGFYLLGRNYAIKAYEPYAQARTLVLRATSSDETLWMKETDSGKYLDGEKRTLLLYEQAAGLIKTDIFHSNVKDFFNSLYQVNKEILDYDEHALTGKLTLTKEEANKTVTELVKKRDGVWSTLPLVMPFWVGFFRIQ